MFQRLRVKTELQKLDSALTLKVQFRIDFIWVIKQFHDSKFQFANSIKSTERLGEMSDTGKWLREEFSWR